MNCSECDAELYFKFHIEDGIVKYLCRGCGAINFTNPSDVVLEPFCVCGAAVKVRESRSGDEIFWRCTGKHEIFDSIHYSTTPAWVKFREKR
jgi:hypothetical protein